MVGTARYMSPEQGRGKKVEAHYAGRELQLMDNLSLSFSSSFSEYLFRGAPK